MSKQEIKNQMQLVKMALIQMKLTKQVTENNLKLN